MKSIHVQLHKLKIRAVGLNLILALKDCKCDFMWPSMQKCQCPINNGFLKTLKGVTGYLR